MSKEREARDEAIQKHGRTPWAKHDESKPKRGAFVIDGHTEIREYRDGPDGKPIFTDAK